MSAYPLTAAREQKFRDRSFGPLPDSCIAAKGISLDYLVSTSDQLATKLDTLWMILGAAIVSLTLSLVGLVALI